MAKGKTYRLQIVLDRRKTARDDAARVLAEKRVELKRQQEEESRLRQELAQNRNRREAEYDAIVGQVNGFDANSVQMRLNFIKKLDYLAGKLQIQIDEQVERVKQAQAAVDESLQALIEASKELKVMEKHKENWQRKTRKIEELKEQNETNEIGNVLYNAGRAQRVSS